MIEEMQHYYDRRAEIYDTSMGYDNPDTVTLLQPVIEHLCREVSRKKVLELACGPCFWTQFTAAVAESIVACDFNNSTLSQACHKDLPWERVSLQQADAYDLKTLTGSFSAAMADAVGVSAAIKRGEVSALEVTEKAKDYSYSSRYLIPRS